jgi:hypothetical protein
MASTTNAIAQPQPKAQRQRRHRQQGGEAQQLARHEHQALALGHRARRHHGQVHEDAWQVEQAGEPAGDEDDVEGFDPEHGCSLRER